MFLISLNLFCSSKYHSFGEIIILKVSTNFILTQNEKKWADFALFTYFIKLICIFKSPPNLGKLFILIFPITMLYNVSSQYFLSAKNLRGLFRVGGSISLHRKKTLTKKNFICSITNLAKCKFKTPKLCRQTLYSHYSFDFKI